MLEHATRQPQGETLGGHAMQQRNTTTTRQPREAIAWLRAGRPLKIAAINCTDLLRHVRALMTLEQETGKPVRLTRITQSTAAGI